MTGGASGFELAFKADALWVGTSIDRADGPAGRLKATAAAVTHFRTGLEGSRAYTLAGRLSLKPSVQVGLRHDGGDAETGAAMDVGAGLVVSDASTGLSVVPGASRRRWRRRGAGGRGAGPRRCGAGRRWRGCQLPQPGGAVSGRDPTEGVVEAARDSGLRDDPDLGDVSPALVDPMLKPRPEPEDSGFVRLGAAEHSAVEDAAGGGPSGARARVETLPSFLVRAIRP